MTRALSRPTFHSQEDVVGAGILSQRRGHAHTDTETRDKEKVSEEARARSLAEMTSEYDMKISRRKIQSPKLTNSNLDVKANNDNLKVYSGRPV